MKSTIKNAYQRRHGADGTLTLEYRASRFGANQMAMGPVFLFLIAMGFLTTFIVGMIILVPLFANHQDIHVMGGLLFACVTTFWLVRRTLGARTYTLVLTPEGLIFPRFSYGSMTDQLPYADISSLGLSKMRSNHRGFYSESCNVYAYAGGIEVKLTREIPQSLAETLIQEINQYRVTVAA